MAATIRPSSPGPRNTAEAQTVTGRQIIAIEAETHNECKRRPIRVPLKDQSAQAVLIAPKAAASSCIRKISIIRSFSTGRLGPLALHT
jgi:hypothetical protein